MSASRTASLGTYGQSHRRPPESSDEFVTVEELARTLRPDQPIHNWIDAGKLPAMRIGRRVRVIRRDLYDLLDRSLTAVEREDEDHLVSDAQGF